MSKEEPAWKAEMRKELEIALMASGEIENVYVRRRALVAVLPSVEALIKAAEQRGFSAAASSVGRAKAVEIKRLKAENADMERYIRQAVVSTTSTTP